MRTMTKTKSMMTLINERIMVTSVPLMTMTKKTKTISMHDHENCDDDDHDHGDQEEVGRLYLNTNDTDIVNLFPAGFVFHKCFWMS